VRRFWPHDEGKTADSGGLAASGKTQNERPSDEGEDRGYKRPAASGKTQPGGEGGNTADFG
jgi:hypothetical protein